MPKLFNMSKSVSVYGAVALENDIDKERRGDLHIKTILAPADERRCRAEVAAFADEPGFRVVRVFVFVEVRDPFGAIEVCNWC